MLRAALLVCACAFAQVHDDAGWLSGRKNPAGELCCGMGDCAALPKDSVAVWRGGYHVQVRDNLDTYWLINETVPFSESQPSPDNNFWRCRRPDGSRRCFFAPPPST